MAPLTSRLLTTAATGLTVAAVLLAVVDGDGPATIICVAALVAVATGWLIAIRDPRSAVGPALAWSSAAVACVMAVEVLARSAYGGSPYPLADLARPLWVGMWPVNMAGVLCLLLVFPDGALLARRWAVVPAVYAGGTALMIACSWDARQVDGRVVGGPQGAGAAVAGLVGLVVIGGSLVLAMACVVLRYRRGGQKTREQIRWLMLTGFVTVASLVLGWAALSLGATVPVAFTPFLVGVVVLLPASVGIAIVRHDLFDVDRLLGTTTAWVLTLTGSAAVYAAVVFGVGRLLDENTALAPPAAAFVTALTLLPLQRHLATATARLVDHDRFVALGEVERFAREVQTGEREPEDVEAVLRAAQRDPGLRLVLARPDGSWVDLRGTVVDSPAGLAVRAHGTVIARITLGHESARARRRLADLARAGWVPIEVSRLRLELREALAEAEAGRARLAEASVAERKRLERDLHDGVQPRLVATGMRLRSIQRGLGVEASAEVDAAVDELESTVVELRRLAHGIRPSRLDDGLGAALASLRTDGPVPVQVRVAELPELDDLRSLTAYFVASEGVANALKHAHAACIEVCAQVLDGRLVVEVRDDGVGGVAPLGLTGLRDRVLSLQGELVVVSAAGTGTTIRAVL
ncbi:histidine kinase [Nocardioides sp.]|uniref:sensor histidine kinase n=1 Tax=Nocardioides sp. TaxID=35761 RepID=UPI003D0B4770